MLSQDAPKAKKKSKKAKIVIPEDMTAMRDGKGDILMLQKDGYKIKLVWSFGGGTTTTLYAPSGIVLKTFAKSEPKDWPDILLNGIAEHQSKSSSGHILTTDF